MWHPVLPHVLLTAGKDGHVRLSDAVTRCVRQTQHVHFSALEGAFGVCGSFFLLSSEAGHLYYF